MHFLSTPTSYWYRKYHSLFNILSQTFLKQFAIFVKAFQIYIGDFLVVFSILILNWSLLTSNVQRNLQQDCLKLSKALSEGRLCWSDLEVEELEKVAWQVWGKTDNNGFLTKQHSSEKNPTNPKSCDFDNFECHRTLKRQSWSRTDWVPFTQSRP